MLIILKGKNSEIMSEFKERKRGTGKHSKEKNKKVVSISYNKDAFFNI